MGSVYKIMAKVLANRLKSKLSKIISNSQNSFINGRQSLDSVIIANLCLAIRLRLGPLRVLCKFDIKKAYVGDS